MRACGRVWSRRRFLASGLGLAGAALLAGCGVPLPGAQPVTRRLGYLASGPPVSDYWQALRERLPELGWVEGRNLQIEYRYGGGELTTAAAAAEMVRLAPDVIWVPSVTDTRAAREATEAIPIVCGGAGDLLASGLVGSLGRPGANVTGMSTPLLAGKHVQLLQDLVPGLRRVGVLYDTVLAAGSSQLGPLREALGTLGLEEHFVGVSEVGDLEGAFASLVGGGVDGLVILLGPTLNRNEQTVANLTLRARLPSVWQNTSGVSRGGLLGYGPNRVDLARRSATYVDRIFKGARPGELPVEQPTLYDFVLNLKTAEALGLAIPPAMLQAATEVVR